MFLPSKQNKILEIIDETANSYLQGDSKPYTAQHEEKGSFPSFHCKVMVSSKHSRPDIQTAVEFFTTWVTKPDEDDYKKLAREILYLREMMNMTLNSSASNTEMCNGG